jgi:hypothetical protein
MGGFGGRVGGGINAMNDSNQNHRAPVKASSSSSSLEAARRAYEPNNKGRREADPRLAERLSQTESMLLLVDAAAGANIGNPTMDLKQTDPLTPRHTPRCAAAAAAMVMDMAATEAMLVASNEIEARRWEAAVMKENEVEEVRIEGRVDTLQRAMAETEGRKWGEEKEKQSIMEKVASGMPGDALRGKSDNLNKVLMERGLRRMEAMLLVRAEQMKRVNMDKWKDYVERYNVWRVDAAARVLGKVAVRYLARLEVKFRKEQLVLQRVTEGKRIEALLETRQIAGTFNLSQPW